jgi:hypothetical protein
MLRPNQVEIDERDLERLTHLYKTAYAQIIAEMETATDFGIRNRKAILLQIQGILKELDSDSAGILDNMITQQYETGATAAVDQLQQVSDDIPAKIGFNRIHKEAIAAIVSETQTAFAQSIQGIYRSSSRFLNQAVKDQLTEQMALGKLKGEALRTIKRNVVGKLREEGLSAITDKAGRQWTLDRYAEMLIRTKSVEARNTGMMNRTIENDYDLAQVSAHGATDQCAPWEGVIISLRGETPGYPTLADAEAAGLFHPNCRHAINTLVPELAAVTNAYNPNIDTLTGAEFVDQVDEKFKGLTKPATQKIGTKTPAK